MFGIRKSMFKTTQNQIFIENLQPKTVQSETISFNKKTQTIDLITDKNLIFYSPPYVPLEKNRMIIESFQFNNLNSKYLYLLSPYVILSTFDGYSLDNAMGSGLNVAFWWEEPKKESESDTSILILKIWMRFGFRSPYNIDKNPTFFNLKIKVHNPKLFNLFYGVK